MSPPSATATGTLGSTPLLNLVVYALDHHLTGTLVLEEPDRQKHAIYFDGGAPAKVRAARPVAVLGEVLADFGHIADSEREPTYAAARAEGRLLGEALVLAGRISERQLRDALREQCTRKILYLGGLSPDTIFGYYDGVNYLERWGGLEAVRGRPLAVVWRLVQAYANPAHVAQVLSAYGDHPLRLHLEAPIGRFQFDRSEQSVIEVLRAKPQPLRELIERDLCDRGLLERVMYALAITRQFDVNVPGAEPLGVDEAPSSSRIQLPSFTPPAGLTSSVGALSQPPLVSASSMAPASQSAPPQNERPEVRELKAEIRGRAARLDDNHYEVLGLTREATVTDIQAAYLTLAKKLHPDRLGPEYQDVAELGNRVFARITEAHQVLTDTAQRREYNLKLRKAGAEAHELEHVQRVLRAATAFQKAEVLMKRNNLAQAEAHAKQALADDPDQADHLALVAWIAAHKPDPDLKALVKDLDRAITMQPNNLRAHWYRGQLYKRMGKDSRAIQDFRFIIERDPRHVDATREVRLYQMRRQGPPGASSYPPGTPSIRPSPMPQSAEKPKSESSSSSLISKLFKR